MKSFILIAFTFISLLMYSCGGGGKSTDPTPTATITGTTSGTTSGTTGGTTGGNSYTFSRVDIKTGGGNGAFDDSGNLISTKVSEIGSVLQTTSGGSAKLTLVHAEGGTITKANGVLTETFKNYDTTDTTKQAYIRVITINDTKKTVTEYRGYIIGKDATLNYIANVVPNITDGSAFQSKFVSSTQKVVTPTQ